MGRSSLRPGPVRVQASATLEYSIAARCCRARTVFRVVSEAHLSTRVLVAVIAYNEAPNLEGVIEDLRSHCDHDVIIVDNGSTDDTAAIARRLAVPCVSHCVNTGQSMGTVKTYFQYAWHHGYDVVCQFDGDGQHDATYLDAIIAPVLEDRADYVIGSRFIQHEGFQSSATRRLVIQIFSLVASRIVGREITDITSGFRACGQRLIQLFGHEYKHELYDTIQLLLLAHYNGARTLEVPVEMRPRKGGASEFTLWRAVWFPLLMTLNVVSTRLQRKQIQRKRRA